MLLGQHRELYNGVEPIFDGSFTRLPISKDIVCPGTFVLFSEGGGCAVGQIVAVSGPAVGKVSINVFCPPHPEENVVPLQHSYLHNMIEVSLLCVHLFLFNYVLFLFIFTHLCL